MNFFEIMDHIRTLTMLTMQYYNGYPIPHPDANPNDPNSSPWKAPQSELDFMEFLYTLTPGVLHLLLAILRIAQGYEYPMELLNAYHAVSHIDPMQAIIILTEEPFMIGDRLEYGLDLLEHTPNYEEHLGGEWPDTRKPLPENTTSETAS